MCHEYHEKIDDFSHPLFVNRASNIRLISSKNKVHPSVSTSHQLLKEIITLTGYSLPEIAKETTIPIKILYRIDEGTTKDPRLKTFQRLLGLYCRVVF